MPPCALGQLQYVGQAPLCRNDAGPLCRCRHILSSHHIVSFLYFSRIFCVVVVCRPPVLRPNKKRDKKAPFTYERVTM